MRIVSGILGLWGRRFGGIRECLFNDLGDALATDMCCSFLLRDAKEDSQIGEKRLKA
jgi:hypothetical protein